VASAESKGEHGGRERRSRKAIAAALEAGQAMAEGRPLRLALSTALARAGALGPKERRSVAVAARGLARWRRTCDAALSLARAPRTIPADQALLRYLAWRIAVLGEPPEPALRDLALPGPRRPRALSDEALRGVALALPRPGERGPASIFPSGAPVTPPRDPAVALGLRYSVPDLLAAKLLEELGPAEAAACLAALDEEPRLALRVNAARAGRDEVIARLRAAGVSAERGDDPLAVRVLDRAGLFDAPPFREGLVEVQDEGSQAVVAACRAGAGERWLDLCAGSGGKSLALAALGARVTAWDASARRLADLPRRARRARLEVEVAAAPPAGSFDGVLVDAPCSGSGALQREPDARWRIDEAALSRLTAAQDEVLARAALLVRPGGAIVYATCSVLRDEGEARVARLLAAGGFALDEERRRWPHRDAGGGFYLARLVRLAFRRSSCLPTASRGESEGFPGLLRFASQALNLGGATAAPPRPPTNHSESKTPVKRGAPLPPAAR
jgi:16S rRNA (cytosine967-C5)-methyltransferase